MKKRFIICYNPGIPAQDEAFKNWLTTCEVGWWHWLAGTWLVADPYGRLSVEQIRDALGRTHPGMTCIVFEVHGSTTWAGFGPATPPQDMGEWLVQHWDK